MDGYSPITVAAVPSENLQSLSVSPELEERGYTPDTGYTGFSDVTVAPAIPFTMSNFQLKQCYYGTSSTSILNAQALCFDSTDFKNAAETIKGDYVITYFISVVVSTANFQTLQNNILNYWNTAISYQSNEGGAISIVAYTRGSTGGYTLNTIV